MEPHLQVTCDEGFWPEAAPASKHMGRTNEYHGIVAVSFAMRRLIATLKRLEGSLVSVLLLGESGVGKDLVARALHGGSSVSSGPFVAKNCATMTRELVQSELFGHVRGAFTGAIESRVGAFEAAHGGTLFLDEIGEVPHEVQPMLLRVLETGEVTPIGCNKTRRPRVRLVSATNQAIDDRVRADGFRRDLFYRLAVVKLEVPSLRERAEDIPLLARHFARSAGIDELPSDVMDRLTRHSWPGNVRELKNALDAYAALGTLPELGPAECDALDRELSRAVDLARPLQEQRQVILERFTREYLKQLLARSGGNQSAASRISGTERSHLRRLLSKHGLMLQDRESDEAATFEAKNLHPFSARDNVTDY